jgi:hypothetical protein
MLDLHATTSIPGTTVTLGTAAPAIAANDLASVAGVPLRNDARLIQWGVTNIAADAIARAKLQSQDCVDPINGEDIYCGTASVKTLVTKFTSIPYKTGSRNIYSGCNTGHAVASINFLLDYYESGGAIGGAGLRFKENVLTVKQLMTVDVAATWVATAFAPATAIPNGKYALLGFYLGQSTEGHGIRFQHADFGQFFPGIPCLDHFIAKTTLDDPLNNDAGFQFVRLSELLGGKNTVPVFTVSNAGTGLNIQSIAAANTDTSDVSLNLVKVG